MAGSIPRARFVVTGLSARACHRGRSDGMFVPTALYEGRDTTGQSSVRSVSTGNRHEYRHVAGRPVGPSPRRHLRRGMGRTRTARRLLPAGPPFRHDRPDLQSHHGAGAGAGPSLPDQPVRPALFRDHCLQPGQDRSRRHAGRRSGRRASTRPVTSSMPASTAPGRTCRR